MQKEKKKNRMDLMWKRLFLSLFITLLISAALFPQQLLFSVIAWKTKSDFKRRFAADFSYHKLYWHEGKIQFEKGRIISPAVFEATFDKATFSPYINFRKRELGGTLKLYNLHIRHQKKEPLLVFSPKKRILPFFKMNLRTLVDEGELWIESASAPIGLNVKQQVIGEKMLGLIILECEQKPLETYFSYEKGSFELASYFHEHSFSLFSEIVRYFFGDFLPPQLRQWRATEGKINGKLSAKFEQQLPSYLGGNLQLWDVHAVNDELGIKGCFEAFTSTFDIETRAAHQWNGEFSLTGGNLSLKEQGLSEIWDIDSLHSTIVVNKGQVETSFVKGKVLGLEGEIKLDWHSSKALMQIACSGSSKEMLPLVPERFQKGFSLSLPDNHLELDAELSRHLEGLELKGKLHIDDMHTLAFGCQFGGGVDKALPLVADAIPESDFLNHLKSQFCLSKKRLGWFKAKQFPLEKFLSPYLFLDLPIHLSGTLNVEGNFDDRYLVMFYDGGGVSLKTPGFEISTPQIAEASSKVAIHTVDLETKEHVGYLTLKSAKFRQKKYDLNFDDVTASVQFHNQMIYLTDIQTHWQNLPFSGEVDFLFKSLSDYGLTIRGKMKQGSCMVGGRLLSHFISSPLAELPLAGTFSLEQMLFSFDNGKLIGGNLLGECSFEMAPFYATSGRFSYDHQSKMLKLEEAKGELQMAKNSFAFQIPQLSLGPKKMEMQLCFTDSQAKEQKLSGYFDRGSGQICFFGQGVNIEGAKLGEKISFPKLTLGKWSATAEMNYRPCLLEIEKMIIEHPQKGNAHLTASYNLSSHVLKGVAKELKVNITQMLPHLRYPLKGHLFATGDFRYENKNFSAQFTANSADLACGKIALNRNKQFKARYLTNKGLTIDGLEAMGEYRLGTLLYDFTKQTLLLESFDFSLSAQRLDFLTDLAKEYFPAGIPDGLITTVKGLKQQGLLEGKLKMRLAPAHLSLSLKLKDGDYRFLNRSWQVRDFSLCYDPADLHIKTTTFFQQKPYELFLKSNDRSMSQGDLCISDETDSLTASWYRMEDEKFTFKQITGSLLGFKAKLEEGAANNVGTIEMRGRVQVDPEQLALFCPPRLKELYDSYKLQGNFVLDGTFHLSKADPKSSTFHGRMEGSDCLFHNVELATLSSHCYLSSDLIEFTDLQIKDWSGRLFVDRAAIVRRRNWEFYLSHVMLQDFRPFRLTSKGVRREKKERPLLRSLFIQSWDIRDFKGVLSKPESYMGYGELCFTNFPRRSLLSNIMLLPTEISARIGFDLSAFIPIRGSILYTIENGKVNLKELKEVYSEGKRSKFYLVDKSAATIDFKGNMNINIRVKQYNLLLKLAELFTITLKGTVKNPSYVFTSASQTEM